MGANGPGEKSSICFIRPTDLPNKLGRGPKNCLAQRPMKSLVSKGFNDQTFILSTPVHRRVKEHQKDVIPILAYTLARLSQRIGDKQNCSLALKV